MKKINFILRTILIVGIVSLTFSCEKEDSGTDTSNIDTLESVSVNTTLNPLKIYIVISAVQVNATLTIPAGTIIKFEQGMRIDVNANGNIIAEGTALKPIIFTSMKDDAIGGDTNGDKTATIPNPKDWGTVTNWGNNSVFTYCMFFYGGGWGDHTATLDIRDSKADVTYCTFAFNYGGLLNDNTNGALCITAADYDINVKYNIFYGNDIPMAINDNMSMDTTNMFHDPADTAIKNKYNGIFVSYYTNDNAVEWEENEVPFVITGHMGIESTASLTLNSDVVLKMYAGTRIDITEGGTLTHHNAIITSFKDDAYLGDTNGDGNLTSASEGDWTGINLGYGDYMTGDNILYSVH